MNPLISLVIPVYNVEKYLRKCLDSVLAQTYDNFEAILVDDGSTDSSGKICDEYAEKDNRIIVYHKPNGGLSDARNYGVEQCNGDLVSFIDSDDYVTVDYVEYLYSLIEKYDADMSIGQFVRINEGDTFTINKNDKKEDTVIDPEQALKKICLGDQISTVAIAKLYKKSILLSNKFPFGAYYEDVAIMYKLISDSKKISVGNKKIYLYVQRNKSILHSAINEKHMNILTFTDEMFRYITDNYPNISQYADIRCCTSADDVIIRVLENEGSKKEYYYKAQKYLKSHIKNLYKCKEVSLHVKIDNFFILKGYYIAKIYWRLRSIAASTLKR